MIQKFVECFEQGRAALRERFTREHPESYEAIVRAVCEVLHDPDKETPDPTRIRTIDDGDYQGTLLFVIASNGYQPSTYWAVSVSYGSCSGCDTLQSVRGYSDEAPTPTQTEEYMTLATHILQGLHQIAGYGMADGEPI